MHFFVFGLKYKNMNYDASYFFKAHVSKEVLQHM